MDIFKLLERADGLKNGTAAESYDSFYRACRAKILLDTMTARAVVRLHPSPRWVEKARVKELQRRMVNLRALYFHNRECV